MFDPEMELDVKAAISQLDDARKLLVKVLTKLQTVDLMDEIN